VSGLFRHLFAEAETVRWRMTDIPWESIERERVTPGLIGLVREIARSELTTYSATRRFLEEFADDVELSQWMSVWFYEESKHPEALLRWLEAFGEGLDERAILRGRVSAPFMRSRLGTLVTNVISEMTAAAGYVGLARRVPEPVLAGIVRRLAGDEARHAASFFRFAGRALATAADPLEDRLTALKVLKLWLMDRSHHPMRQLSEHVRDDAVLQKESSVDYEALGERVCRVIGRLVDLPLTDKTTVEVGLRELTRRKGERWIEGTS